MTSARVIPWSPGTVAASATIGTSASIAVSPAMTMRGCARSRRHNPRIMAASSATKPQHSIGSGRLGHCGGDGPGAAVILIAVVALEPVGHLPAARFVAALGHDVEIGIDAQEALAAPGI